MCLRIVWKFSCKRFPSILWRVPSLNSAFASGPASLSVVTCLTLNPNCAYGLFSLSVPAMEMERFELLTPCLQGRCSPN